MTRGIAVRKRPQDRLVHSVIFTISMRWAGTLQTFIHWQPCRPHKDLTIKAALGAVRLEKERGITWRYILPSSPRHILRIDVKGEVKQGQATMEPIVMDGCGNLEALNAGQVFVIYLRHLCVVSNNMFWKRRLFMFLVLTCLVSGIGVVGRCRPLGRCWVAVLSRT